LAGNLIITPIVDVVIAANFSFNLTNPAREQAANANITLDVRRTNYETPSGVRMFPDFRLSLPSGVEDNFYPLAVENAKIVRAKIGQRSPFLCDANVITLAIASNVSLQHCKTIITVSGLTGMAGSGELSKWRPPTVLRGAGLDIPDSDFTFVLAEGVTPELTFDLKSLKSATAAAGSDLKFMVSFNFSSPNARLEGEGTIDPVSSCPKLSLSATKQSCSGLVEPLGHAALEFSDVWLVIQNIDDMSAADKAPREFDHHPLCFREFGMNGSALQTTSNPCQHTTRITIIVTPLSPIFSRCNFVLTITGLTPSCSDTVEVRSTSSLWGASSNSSTTWTSLSISDDDSITSEWKHLLASQWNSSTGTLIVTTSNFEQLIKGGQDLDLSFFLQRGSAADGGVTALKLSTSGLTTPAEVPITFHTGSAPLQVDAMMITSAELTQSSVVACSNTSISVSFELSHDIDTICSPEVTISGLTGKLTPTGKRSVQVTAEGQQPQKLTGNWDKSAGTLVMQFMPKDSNGIPVRPAYGYVPDARLVEFGLFAPAKKWILEFDIMHPPKDEETKDFNITIGLSGACSGLVLSSKLDIMNESTQIETTTFTTKQIGQTVTSPARLLTRTS